MFPSWMQKLMEQSIQLVNSWWSSSQVLNAMLGGRNIASQPTGVQRCRLIKPWKPGLEMMKAIGIGSLFFFIFWMSIKAVILFDTFWKVSPNPVEDDNILTLSKGSVWESEQSAAPSVAPTLSWASTLNSVGNHWQRHWILMCWPLKSSVRWRRPVRRPKGSI